MGRVWLTAFPGSSREVAFSSQFKSLAHFSAFLSVVSVFLSSLQPEVQLQEDSPEIYRLAPNLESFVVINSRLLSRLLSPGMDCALLRLRRHDPALWDVCAAECLLHPPRISVGRFRRVHKFVCAGQVHLSVHGWRPKIGNVSLCLRTFWCMYLCVGREFVTVCFVPGAF